MPFLHSFADNLWCMLQGTTAHLYANLSQKEKDPKKGPFNTIKPELYKMHLVETKYGVKLGLKSASSVGSAF